MARSSRSALLETRSSRLKLTVAKKPVFVKIGPGLGLGYRRNQTAGTWVARVADGRGGNWTKAIGIADDFDDVDGLTFWLAQEKARALARGGETTAAERATTVEDALAAYERDLGTRQADIANVQRVRKVLTATLRDKAVVLLTTRELRRWRDGLLARLAPASVNRTLHAFKAALNLAAATDERIITRRAWEAGLTSLPGAAKARNVILSQRAVRAIITAARQINHEFGMLIEVAAVSGARYSQIARLEVQDLQGNRDLPRLMMPRSRKGAGVKKITQYPVPISMAAIWTCAHRHSVTRPRSGRRLRRWAICAGWYLGCGLPILPSARTGATG
jgi:hypothetical protein